MDSHLAFVRFFQEEGIVIHAGRTTSRGRPQRKSFGGKNMTYTRPDALSPHSLLSPSLSKGEGSSGAMSAEDELKKLRFLRHATAFDVDVNALEDHPWRNKTVDLLDYFNYGFNERTWLVSVLLCIQYFIVADHSLHS